MSTGDEMYSSRRLNRHHWNAHAHFLIVLIREEIRLPQRFETYNHLEHLYMSLRKCLENRKNYTYHKDWQP